MADTMDGQRIYPRQLLFLSLNCSDFLRDVSHKVKSKNISRGGICIGVMPAWLIRLISVTGIPISKTSFVPEKSIPRDINLPLLTNKLKVDSDYDDADEFKRVKEELEKMDIDN